MNRHLVLMEELEHLKEELGIAELSDKPSVQEIRSQIKRKEVEISISWNDLTEKQREFMCRKWEIEKEKDLERQKELDREIEQ